MKKPSIRIKKKKNHGKRKKKYIRPVSTQIDRVHILETGSLAEMRAEKAYFEEVSRYNHLFYSELTYQRSLHQDKIVEALNYAAVSEYEFSGWQRVVKYKYSLHPLSTVGSIKDIGGRFNVGLEINPENYPVFHALYIAEDKDTALQETLGQFESNTLGSTGITPLQLVLTADTSISVLNIQGKLDRVIDLTKIETLKGFIDIIKKFSISDSVYALAKKLGLPPPTMIKTVEQLKEALNQDNWREVPRKFDIPAPSQVFGQILKSANIEGVLYNSKFTNKKCLAIFPENFPGTASYIELTDQLAHTNTPKRIDASSWRKCLLDVRELFTDLH